MVFHKQLTCSSSIQHLYKKMKYLVQSLPIFKKFTSQQIIKAIKEEPESRRDWLLQLFSNACAHLSRKQNYKVWQDGYHAIETTSNKFIYQKLNYIHQNPVEACVVASPEEYLYSSARNYASLDYLLEVIVLPPKLITV